MDGVRRPGARLLLGLGAVGDRTDELLGRLGEIGAMGADVVAIAHKERYLRGRTREELDGLLRDGAERVGVTDVTSYDTEVDCLAGLVAAGPARRRGRADVPRPARGGLRLDRRARRYAGHARRRSARRCGQPPRARPRPSSRRASSAAWRGCGSSPTAPSSGRGYDGRSRTSCSGSGGRVTCVGDRPEEAFFVRCDATTMTQNDLDNGRLVVEIGLATVRPAEFVILRIGQWTASATPDDPDS